MQWADKEPGLGEAGSITNLTIRISSLCGLGQGPAVFGAQSWPLQDNRVEPDEFKGYVQGHLLDLEGSALWIASLGRHTVCPNKRAPGIVLGGPGGLSLLPESQPWRCSHFCNG